MKIYLAGPFFNEEQLHVINEVALEALRLGYDIFSPRSKCFCPPNASLKQRTKSFEGNCEGIEYCEVILARIDDFDPGTVWELGFAHGIRHVSSTRLFSSKIPRIYAYTTIPSRGLNLMLALGVDGFLQGLPSVFKFLHEMITMNSDTEAKKWQKQIV